VGDRSLAPARSANRERRAVRTSGATAKRPSGTTATKRSLATEQRRLGALHAEAVAAAWHAHDLAREEAASIRREAVELADRNHREGIAEALAVLHLGQGEQSDRAPKRQSERSVLAQDALGAVRETLDRTRLLAPPTPRVRF